jgi:Phage integrase SAM-like domain
VLERHGKRGSTYGLRFRAGGTRHYVTVAGSREDAERELRRILSEVERGIWRPPAPVAVAEPVEEPTFHEFASDWLEARELEGLAAKSTTDLRWSLSNHLLPFFAEHRLSEITVREVDRFKTSKARKRQELDEARARGEKVRERGLSNNSINHVLSDLSQVLETAVEYELLRKTPPAGSVGG